MKRNASAALLVLTALASGCYRPYQAEVVEYIGTNETAFLVPLEGDMAAQVQADSEQLKTAKQIFAKRVTIPTRWRQTDRFSWQGEWIPTVRIIKVDRSEITRYWIYNAKDAGAGSSVILAQSSEPVRFAVGVTVTATILEDNAHKYLYSYRGKSLAEVVDQNVRSYLQSYFGHEFASRNLKQCQIDKADIFAAAVKAVQAEFETFGVTINVIGNVEGLIYLNPAVQAAIDEQFKSQLRNLQADQLQQAQAVRNSTAILVADLRRQAAEALHLAQEPMQFQTSLEVAKLEASAELKASEKFVELSSMILPRDSAPQLLLPTSGASSPAR